MSRWFWAVPVVLAAVLAVAGPAFSDVVASDDDATYLQDDAVPAELEPGIEEAYDEPDADADAAAEASATGGAVVRSLRCTIEGRPFIRALTISGRLVVTPSGNTTLVCHGRANAKVIRTPVDEAIVIQGGACTIPPRRTTNDSQLVVTPSLHVTLVCHVNPSP
jgi:hypothetical protein